MAEMTYKHGSPDRVTNRTCHYDADDNDWYYTPAAAIKGTQIKCPWEHPQLNTLAALGNDRGEFGMPAIGHSLHDAMGSEWQDAGEVPAGSSFAMSVDMPDFEMLVTQRGITLDYGETGNDVHATTDDARYILTKVLPGLLER